MKKVFNGLLGLMIVYTAGCGGTTTETVTVDKGVQAIATLFMNNNEAQTSTSATSVPFILALIYGVGIEATCNNSDGVQNSDTSIAGQNWRNIFSNCTFEFNNLVKKELVPSDAKKLEWGGGVELPISEAQVIAYYDAIDDGVLEGYCASLLPAPYDYNDYPLCYLGPLSYTTVKVPYVFPSSIDSTPPSCIKKVNFDGTLIEKNTVESPNGTFPLQTTITGTLDVNIEMEDGTSVETSSCVFAVNLHFSSGAFEGISGTICGVDINSISNVCIATE